MPDEFAWYPGDPIPDYQPSWDAGMKSWWFHRQHELFMRDSGFPDWHWPEPLEIVPYCEADIFEEWLIERWLAHIRSEEFQESADYHFLRAEFEREMTGDAHGVAPR